VLTPNDYSACLPGSSNSSRILNPITSAPNRIFSSRMPNAKAFGNEPLGTAEGSSGNLHEKLQCGHAMGISRISSGETVSRDLHLWHSNVIARISSNPTTILRSNVTLRQCTTQSHTRFRPPLLSHARAILDCRGLPPLSPKPNVQQESLQARLASPADHALGTPISRLAFERTATRPDPHRALVRASVCIFSQIGTSQRHPRP